MTYGEMTADEQEAYLRESQDMTEVIREHRPTRASEAVCWDLLAKRGWCIQKRGWPDFLCTGHTADHRQITFCVEVKRHPEDVPRPDQLDMMRTLEGAKIPCFVWDRHMGFRRVGSFRPDDGEPMGKQPGDVDCPDPSILRCVWCEGGGKEWAKNPEPGEEVEYRKCTGCNGSGLAVPKLEAVEAGE